MTDGRPGRHRHGFGIKELFDQHRTVGKPTMLAIVGNGFRLRVDDVVLVHPGPHLLEFLSRVSVRPGTKRGPLGVILGDADGARVVIDVRRKGHLLIARRRPHQTDCSKSQYGCRDHCVLHEHVLSFWKW